MAVAVVRSLLVYEMTYLKMAIVLSFNRHCCMQLKLENTNFTEDLLNLCLLTGDIAAIMNRLSRPQNA